MVIQLGTSGTDALPVLKRAIEKNAEIYDHALLRFVIVKGGERNILYTGRLDFLNSADRKSTERLYDYGNVTFASQIVGVKEALEKIEQIGRKETVSIRDISSLEIEEVSFDTPWFIPSKSMWGYVNYDWPHINTFIALRSQLHVSTSFGSLVKLGLPAYPSFEDAIRLFLDLDSKQYTTDRRVIIVVPDYRARITGVLVSNKKITLQVDSLTPDKNKDIIGKFYFSDGHRSYNSPELQLQDGVITHSLEFDSPDFIGAYLVNNEGDRLDYREFNVYGRSVGDLVVETPTSFIEDLIKRGESQTVEFKAEISNTLAETVLAFANTNGGIILLGVDDNSRVVGFKNDSKARDAVTNHVATLCEPPPNIDFESLTLEEKPILLVRIPQGESKPYVLRDRGVFVRRNATNRQATRNELDEFYANRNQRNSDRSVI